MTKYLKSKKTHIIVKCILGIIILSLIFSTMNVYINQDFEKYIVTVNGEKISFKIFENMYLIEREKQKKILGKNFFKLSHNKKFIRETYNYVLSQLINNVLLEQYTKKMNLHINEIQAKEIILHSPIFQKEKKFNKEKYFNYLSSMHMSNHEYINIIKTKINTQNLINTIAKTNFILEDEQKNTIQLLSQERIIKKAIFKINSMINKQNVTDIESKKYFEKNKKKFYTPEKFKINFIKFKQDDFKTACSAQEIRTWYLKNIKKYSTKEKRKYRIIQIKNKNDAILIRSQLNEKPEDFEQIAQKKSTDPISSKKGGDIGWISVDLIPDEIKKENLNQKNSISNVIPFHNEFLIVQLSDIVLSKQKKIDDVYNIIEKEIKNRKSLYLYHNIQNKISNIIKKNPNQLDTFLKENNISFNKTDWFDRKSIPQILDFPIFKKVIFRKKTINKYRTTKSYSSFIALKDNQSFLIKIIDFKNGTIPIFNNIKENIIKKIKTIKAIEETKKISEKIVMELNQGNQDFFKQFNLHFGKSETISRYYTQPIIPVVFSLPHPKKGKNIYTLYQDEDKNFIIISLEKVYNKDVSEKEKKIISEYLEKNNTEIILNNLLKNLYETSIIKYEEIKRI